MNGSGSRKALFAGARTYDQSVNWLTFQLLLRPAGGLARAAFSFDM
jgi:hypothetical protein